MNRFESLIIAIATAIEMSWEEDVATSPWQEVNTLKGEVKQKKSRKRKKT